MTRRGTDSPMRLVHLADLHLDFRQFSKNDATGRNIREGDVMRTFVATVDQVIAMEPDVIVIAGDVFHRIHPSNGSLLDAYTQFKRLTEALPSTPVIMVSGNHDLPRSTAIPCILRLFSDLGIYIVERESMRLTFPSLNLSILGVPDAPGMVRPALDPDPSMKHNVLVLHGEVQGMMSMAHGGGVNATEIKTDEIGPSRWSYIALGHYHVYRELAPNMAYSGSLDFTSSDPWSEMREASARGIPGHGFVERDLETGKQTFHPVPASRRFIELPRVSAFEQSAADLDQTILAAVEGIDGGIDGCVVRMVITDIPVTLSRELDRKVIGAYKGRAVNFNLVFRRPEAISVGSSMRIGRGRARPLEEIVGEFFANRFANHPEFSVEQMGALSQKYVQLATEKIEGTAGLAALTQEQEKQESAA